MVFQLDRKFLGLNDWEYQLSTQNNIFAKISREYIDGKYSYTSSDFGKTIAFLIYKTYKDAVHGDITNLKCAEILVDNNCSQMSYCIEKGKNIFSNRYYWQIDYLGRLYKCYEIGLGKKGTFYCIFCDDETVAIIVKNPKMKFNSTHYDCYSYNNVPFEILLAFNVYIDIFKYYPSKSVYSNKTLHSWQKWLLAKYDPNFIPKIKAQDGIE